MRAPQSERTIATDLPVRTAEVLARLRERRPRVHCITNAVAQAFTANALLALGAVPSMTIARGEIRDFTARADALLVNLGTFDAERRAASLAAIGVANKAGKPWLLDPVFVDRSRPRAAFAKALAGKRPRAIRLNRAEFAALAGIEAEPTALLRYAKAKQSVIGLTGERDVIADGGRVMTLANGDALMARVTAMGCAASAIAAACLTIEPDAFAATAAALLIVGVAGEVAATRARGPGSFAVEFLDALDALDRATLIARAKVS